MTQKYAQMDEATLRDPATYEDLEYFNQEVLAVAAENIRLSDLNAQLERSLSRISGELEDEQRTSDTLRKINQSYIKDLDGVNNAPLKDMGLEARLRGELKRLQQENHDLHIRLGQGEGMPLRNLQAYVTALSRDVRKLHHWLNNKGDVCLKGERGSFEKHTMGATAPRATGSSTPTSGSSGGSSPGTESPEG